MPYAPSAIVTTAQNFCQEQIFGSWSYSVIQGHTWSYTQYFFYPASPGWYSFVIVPELLLKQNVFCFLFNGLLDHFLFGCWFGCFGLVFPWSSSWHLFHLVVVAPLAA